jgi:hypothetical protein
MLPYRTKGGGLPVVGSGAVWWPNSANYVFKCVMISEPYMDSVHAMVSLPYF